MSKRFTQIKGLSQVRRLPRLGKIRLGIKVKKQGTNIEYPKETPYFVVTDEVKAQYGDQPTALDVMIPIEETDISFPQNYAYYGSSRGLKCSGDGEKALRTLAFEKETKGETPMKGDLETLIDVPCTCILADQGKCKQTGYLQVLLPKVSLGGVYQITTSSYNSMVDINSAIDYIKAMVGRIAMVPLKLKRVPTETHHDGKKQMHYTLRLELEADINTLNFLRENTHKVLEGPRIALPVPERENTALDDADVIETETDAPEQPAAAAAAPAAASTAQPAASAPAAQPELSLDAEKPVSDNASVDDEHQLLSDLTAATTIAQVNDVLLKMQKLTDGQAKLRVNREAAKAAKRVTSKGA